MFNYTDIETGVCSFEVAKVFWQSDAGCLLTTCFRLPCIKADTFGRFKSYPVSDISIIEFCEPLLLCWIDTTATILGLSPD